MTATSHLAHDARLPFAGGGTPSPLPATCAAESIRRPLAGDPLAHDQIGFDAQGSRIVGDPLSDKNHPEPSHDALAGDPLAHDHPKCDAPRWTVVGDPSPLPAKVEPTPNRRTPAGDLLAHDHRSRDAQTSPVVGDPSPPPASEAATPNNGPLAGGAAVMDEQLSVRLEVWAFYQGSISSLAETLNDLEQIRIATTHRIGAINRQLGRDSDARVVDDRETERLWELADKLKGVENDAVKELEKLMKQHPLGEWVAATKGCGLKQIARLLAATGNPYWNAKAGRPRRGPAEFWAYCGYSVLPASPHSIRDAHGGPAGGQSPQVTQAHTDTHNGDGDLQSLPASQTTADPQTVPAGGQSPATSQTPREAQESPAGGQPLAPDQAGIDAHGPSVGGDSLHPTDQFPGDALDGPVGGVAQRRQKGQRSNWNNQAKMRAYLVAGSCVKAKAISPYGPLYDAARTKYATAVHAEECSQCGVCATCGKRLGKTKEEHLASTNCPKRVPRPAPAGSPLSPGHQHQRAERIVAKEILKDLYLQAKAWHEREPEDE